MFFMTQAPSALAEGVSFLSRSDATCVAQVLDAFATSSSIGTPMLATSASRRQTSIWMAAGLRPLLLERRLEGQRLIVGPGLDDEANRASDLALEP